MTNAALQAITIDETDLIILDFTYTRAGTDVTGLLSLTSIDVLSASNGSFNSRGYEFDHSNFAKFLEYCDTCVTGWSANVLEKLYDRSQIAAYLERGLTEDISNDLDFIKFWKTVTTFFAFYVCLARQFTVFYTNQEFLAEFLKQRGLIFCNDETFESLTFFLHHYYDEIRKRGTIKIIGNFDNSDISNSTSTSYQLIDGELLRSICKGACDDFIFNYRKKNKVGFNLRNSSPNYRGTSDMEGCNKIWTRLLNITDYLQYPLFSSVQGAFSSVIDSNADGYPIINIGPLYGVDYAGIGLSNVTAPSTVYAKQYGIVVDPNIDYEFNFRIEITGQPHFPFLSVGCNAFDCDGNAIDLLEPKFLNISYNFVEFIGLNKASKYYFFRGIIYSKNKFLDHDETNSYNKHDVVRHSGNFYIAIRPAPVGVLINQTYYWQLLDTDEIDSLFKTNWSQGNNLQFTSDVRMIIPFIKIQATDFISQVKVWNARVQPVATRYSAGFLDTNNWIDFWLKNRNLDYTYDQLKELFRRYLLPYDVVFEFNKLLKDEAILGLPINTHGHINGVPVIVEQENRDIILGIKRCSVIEVNDPDAGPYIPFHAAHPDNYGYHSMQRNLGLQAGESTPFSEMYEILSFKIDGVDIITNSVKIYLNQNNLAVTTGLNGSIQVTNITQMVNSLTRSDILYFFDDMAVFYSSCTTFEIRIAFEHEMSFDNQVHRQYYKYTQDAYYWSAVVDQEVYAVGADYRCHLVDDSGSAS